MGAAAAVDVPVVAVVRAAEDGEVIDLRAIFAAPIQVGGFSVDVGITFGIACVEGDPSARLAAAVAAAEETSEAHNPIAIAETGSQTDLLWDISLRARIDDAMEAGEIYCVYQPKIDLQSNAVVGVEALVRWHDPARGFISPMHFIQQCEKAGRMEHLTRYVLQSACSAGQLLHFRGHMISMSVNISATLLSDMRVVVSGAGAAGTAIARMLRCVNLDPTVCVPVRDIIVCDSKGIINRERDNLSLEKQELLGYTNRDGRSGSLQDALSGADVFIGVSKGNTVSVDDVRSMAGDPVVLAMANPIPEIMPEDARSGGAAIVGTGRSDFPNQVNNVLAFPGIFRGALDAGAGQIDGAMKLAAAHALAAAVDTPTPDQILPTPLDRTVAPKVAAAVARAVGEH